MEPGPTPVGFVGLGNLGSAMVERLLSGGWTVRVHDNDQGKVAPLVELGAEVVEKRTAAAADVLHFAVPDERAVRAVLDLDSDTPRVHPGQVIVLHSTVLPQAARELAADLKRHQAALVEAPVSGGPDRARNGDLVMMLAGDPVDIARVGPVLERLAVFRRELGAHGSAAAVKLANQLVTFATVAGLHEALALTAAEGAAEADVLALLQHGLADSWVLRNWGFFDEMVHSYDHGGTSPADRPWFKDLREVDLASKQADINLPVARLLADTLGDLVERAAHAGGSRSAS